ncbi:MAG: hypothetical protein AAFN93_29565, partial [Bacteroidota bacterium]
MENISSVVGVSISCFGLQERIIKIDENFSVQNCTHASASPEQQRNCFVQSCIPTRGGVGQLVLTNNSVIGPRPFIDWEDDGQNTLINDYQYFLLRDGNLVWRGVTNQTFVQYPEALPELSEGTYSFVVAKDDESRSINLTIPEP